MAHACLTWSMSCTALPSGPSQSTFLTPQLTTTISWARALIVQKLYRKLQNLKCFKSKEHEQSQGIRIRVRSSINMNMENKALQMVSILITVTVLAKNQKVSTENWKPCKSWNQEIQQVQDNSNTGNSKFSKSRQHTHILKGTKLGPRPFPPSLHPLPSLPQQASKISNRYLPSPSELL